MRTTNNSNTTALTYLAPEIEKVERPPLAGPDACENVIGTCIHPFFTTKHPRTLREVHPKDMPTSITDATMSSPLATSRSIAVVREQDRFFQMAIERSPQGERQTKSTMDLVLGAGGIADDVYLTWHADGIMRNYLWPGCIQATNLRAVTSINSIGDYLADCSL